MPLYEWSCECGHLESVFAPVADRDGFRPEHHCGQRMHRLIGGRGLLYFEEGRARVDQGLGGLPITSKREHERRMKAANVTESGDYLSKSVRDNPKSLAMQRYVEKDSKRRWI